MKRSVWVGTATLILFAAYGCGGGAECDELCDRAQECLAGTDSQRDTCVDSCEAVADRSDQNEDDVNDCRDCIDDR